MSKDNMGISALFGVMSAINGAICLENILDYTSTKAVVMQELLSKLPEMSQDAVEASREVAYKLVEFPYFSVGVSAVGAGIMAALSIYSACSKD